MKKLGKPQIGYSAMRKLTAGERKATGLPACVYVMHEHGSGNISFWTAHQSGGHDRYSVPPQQSKKLHDYWEQQ